jgi:hypothetical protein
VESKLSRRGIDRVTGMDALRLTFDDTAPQPCVPITISSAFCSLATLTMSSVALPTVASARKRSGDLSGSKAESFH